MQGAGRHPLGGSASASGKEALLLKRIENRKSWTPILSFTPTRGGCVYDQGAGTF